MTLDAETYAVYHNALELPPGSSPPQIHAQYRRLAKHYHPDRNPHRREWAEEHLRRLNEAYHALAGAGSVPPPPAAPAPPVSPPPSAPLGQEQAARPRAPRRVLRFLALVGLVCGASVLYANRPQFSQMTPAPDISVASSPLPPAIPAAPPDEASEADLAAKFSVAASGVDASVARASQIVARVNAALLHAPQSRRPQRAEQLAADALELSRLQRSVRAALDDMHAPTSPDLRRTQIADVQLALFQMARQQHLVNAEVAAFPAR